MEQLACSKTGAKVAELPAARNLESNANFKRVTISSLLEAWWNEAKATGRKPSTYENYRNSILNFIAFIQHDEADRVTANDVIGFKDYRLSTPSTRTVVFLRRRRSKAPIFLL